MKIAVNTRLLLKDKMDGIGRFAFETLKHMVPAHPDVKFLFLFDRKFDEQFIFSDNITPLVIPPPTRHPLLYKIWFEYSLPYIFKNHRPDLFLSPDGFLSLRSDIKSIPVIHDLNFVHFPDKLSVYSKLYNTNFPQYAKRAARIATVSEFSKADIVKQYNIDEDKIDVVYNGAPSFYQPVDEIVKTATRKKYTGGCNYFVFVGSLYERKNIRNLLLAFEQFKTETSSDFKLLIAGRKVWWSNEVESLYETMRYKSDVIFTGRITDEALKNVMAAAYALTYVSLFEGFGIPILEAMHCHVPVITSDTSSMPEVAGDAALLIDPFSVDQIANAMKQIITDKNLYSILIEKGKEQCKKFSYQNSSNLLWASIEKCI